MPHTSLEFLEQLFNDTPKQCAFRAETPEAFREWQTATRQKLAEVLGLHRMIPCDLAPEKVSVEKMDGYDREKWVIQTEPGVTLPFYLLRPAGATGRLPVVIAPHGHCGGGKIAVCGIDNGFPEIRACIEQHNYDYGVQFVRRGFLVACPDARGFGERREGHLQANEAWGWMASSCGHLNAAAMGLGRCVTGMWTWDLMRLADWLLERPDTGPLAVAGLSGGGMQTLWLAAMDARVRCAVSSGYFYGVAESLLRMNCCACNYVPGLWLLCDMGDIGALCADRGLFIETGDQDGLNGASGLANVFSQVEILRRAAAVLGNERNIGHHVFEGDHRWNGERSIPWLVERMF